MVKYSGSLTEERVFTALADPSRRWLLRRLVGPPRSTTELASGLTMSMPAVLKHLKVLERAHLVKRRKTGRTCFYHLAGDGLVPADRFLAEMRRFWTTRLDELESHLARTAGHAAEPPSAPTPPISTTARLPGVSSNPHPRTTP